MPSSSRPAAEGLRIVFAGTPDFAAHHLQTLLDSRHQVIAVYSQPDRPAGRGKKLTASPVKALALTHNIPVHQPLSLKEVAAQQELAALQADIMVVVAYGLLLPKAVLDTPRLGCINVHASILPRWRGAAPIQRALEAGDTITGVTIMQMDVGLDTGDMLVKAECAILPDDTGGSLHDKLLTIGAPALLEALDQLQHGIAKPESQDDRHSCYAPKLNKDEALLDWRQPAAVLERKVRAFNPFPVAFTQKAGSEDRIRIWSSRVAPNNMDKAPGTVMEVSSTGIRVSCGQDSLLLEQVQLPGKKPMGVDELLRGHPHLFSLGDPLELPA
ncbi:MAG TPA: methionyl-tRNA formyltransferase [Cellvibrio sp.]|nr:methionyl-tRNA formyltransferase [Cellvibrio sp.]